MRWLLSAVLPLLDLLEKTCQHQGLTVYAVSFRGILLSFTLWTLCAGQQAGLACLDGDVYGLST